MLTTALGSRSSRALVLGGLAAALGLTAAGALLAGLAAPSDSCAPPVDTHTLALRDQSFLARSMQACSDHARGALTDAAYRARIAALDAAWDEPPVPAPAGSDVQWASAVRGVSSQYTATSWAATAALGPPDVYPTSGDNPHAWASLGADTGPEWIALAYAQPIRVGAVRIAETYNPGAVTAVVLITTSGTEIVEQVGAAQGDLGGAPSDVRRITTQCTPEPIAAVRIELASQTVPGWNEIDAVGIEPCP